MKMCSGFIDIANFAIGGFIIFSRCFI